MEDFKKIAIYKFIRELKQHDRSFIKMKLMVKWNFKLLVYILIVAAIAISCNKDEASDGPYIENAVGTYTGDIIYQDNTAIQGTAKVSKISDSQVEVRCYGDSLDSTFVMDVYENGDSLMVCQTGNEFYHEYGHMKGDKHMMDMGMGQSEWTHHMEDDHQAGDEHFGGFNIQQHTFEYTFHNMGSDSNEYVIFKGLKQ